MGLLDSIKGLFGGSDQSLTALFDSVKSMVTEGDGLNGLMQKFDAAGLGDKFKSFVGTGANADLTPDEVGKVFGDEKINEFAEKAGVNADQAKEGLSKFIPEFVNKLTPDGNIPGLDDLKGMLDKIPGIGDFLK